MTTRLLLVRHGSTQLTSENRFSGAVGVELSDEGREQTRLLAERLQPEKIAAVYCSPLSRTVETAKILGEPHKLPAIPKHGLEEISHGRWEGLTRQEVEERFPGEYRTVGGRSVHVRAGRRRIRRGGAGAGASGHPRDRRRPPGSVRRRGLAQSDAASPHIQSARLRRPRLPRSSRPIACLPQHRRIQGPGTRAPDAVQRHLALSRHAAPREVTSLEVVGSSSRR